ncbi:MAG: amino acid permease [Bacteroidota bacterium]
MESHHKNNGIETELSRDLGLTSALAIGIGTMIAAGIFTLSGLAIRNVGSSAIISFLLAAIVALFTALTYCEFVSIYPRTGEGYLYARKTYTPPLAYFVGWALFLGYTSSCAFYIASLSSYFQEFVWHSPVEALSGILILVALTALNIKGTEESGKFQIVVTAAKVLLLIWFIFGGLSFVEIDVVLDKMSKDIVAIGSTAAMVFITFFGFSAIAASAGEVKDPVKNIPKAIFISMGVVTLLYTAVVIVVLFAGLEEYTEASMGEAAKKFLGNIGGYVIIAGAIFSMVSASNASIMAGSRVMLSMSQLGHLPKQVGIINPKTKTPAAAVILVGIAIFIFALILPLEDLSFFANTVLLLSLILVNAALIFHRKKYPDIERPFKVPLVPLLPILGILANIYLLVQIFQHPLPFFLALGTLAAGLVGFLLWKGVQKAEAAIPGTSSHIAHSQGRGTLAKEKFRILVPIANPRTSKRLVNMAAAIAKARNGEILLLEVIRVPDQLPPTAFDESVVDKEKGHLRQARDYAESLGIPTHALIRVGHDIARAILETSTERHCNLIILGWKGHTTTAQRILGDITDTVVNHAQTDLMLAKIMGDAPINRIVIPTAGGEHAQCAERYAADFTKFTKGQLTLLQVTSPNASEEELERNRRTLKTAIERIPSDNDLEITTKVTTNDSITDGILQAGKGYDLLMIGAAGKSIYPQILFGSIPEDIAKNIDTSVIIVKHYDRVKSLLGRVVSE